MSQLAAHRRVAHGTAKEHDRGIHGAQGLHKKHPAGHQTSKQLRAERANLVLARAVLTEAKSALLSEGVTKASVGAAEWELALIAALGPHKKSKGKNPHKIKTTGYKRNFRFKTTGYKKNYKFKTTGATFKRHPIGSHELAVSLGRLPSHRTPIGLWKKFQKRKAPSGFLRVTSWSNSRRHHYRKRLFVRKPHVQRLKKWRKTGRFVKVR